MDNIEVYTRPVYQIFVIIDFSQLIVFLLAKPCYNLWCYGFQNQSFDWFESYLTERQQLTLVNNI